MRRCRSVWTRSMRQSEDYLLRAVSPSSQTSVSKFVLHTSRNLVCRHPCCRKDLDFMQPWKTSVAVRWWKQKKGQPRSLWRRFKTEEKRNLLHLPPPGSWRNVARRDEDNCLSFWYFLIFSLLQLVDAVKTWSPSCPSAWKLITAVQNCSQYCAGLITSDPAPPDGNQLPHNHLSATSSYAPALFHLLFTYPPNRVF